MYVTVGATAALILLTLMAARSDDRIAKISALVAWMGSLVAFGSSWVAAYRWSNQSGCPAAYPDEFGYRAPDWEQLPNPVSDTSSWWPLGHRPELGPERHRLLECQFRTRRRIGRRRSCCTITTRHNRCFWSAGHRYTAPILTASG